MLPRLLTIPEVSENNNLPTYSHHSVWQMWPEGTHFRKWHNGDRNTRVITCQKWHNDPRNNCHNMTAHLFPAQRNGWHIDEQNSKYDTLISRSEGGYSVQADPHSGGSCPFVN